jgi:type I restriction enzyme S subunit
MRSHRWRHGTALLMRRELTDEVAGVRTSPARSAPLPSIDKQRDLTDLVKRADKLCRIRRYALQMCDQFLPVAFLEEFGEPRANPNRYPRALVEELGQVETGSTPPRERKEYYGTHVEWIKSDNITLYDIYPTKAVEGLSFAGENVGTVVGPDRKSVV